MKRSLLTGAAILLSMSSVAMAQTATAPSSAAANPPAMDKANGPNVSQKLSENLKQAGFTDVKIMPDSFIVHAKDKSGDPVTMLIDANSMTVFTAADSAGSVTNTVPDVSQKTAAPNPSFTDISARDGLSSKLIGLNVYNLAKQDIGTIKDVAFSKNGVRAYIIGVGGFLGMADHFVAVRPSAVTITYDAADKKWHAAMDANAEQLKAAPEYKYPTNS